MKNLKHFKKFFIGLLRILTEPNWFACLVNFLVTWKLTLARQLKVIKALQSYAITYAYFLYLPNTKKGHLHRLKRIFNNLKEFQNLCVFLFSK